MYLILTFLLFKVVSHESKIHMDSFPKLWYDGSCKSAQKTFLRFIKNKHNHNIKEIDK